MLDTRRNGQHRLQYHVRGPEWAFAIAQGNLDAMEEVMRNCSSFWNGVGSLLIPVRADGRIPGGALIDAYLAQRPVDACWLHGSLSERAKGSVRGRFGPAYELSKEFDRDEAHPLRLYRPPADAPPAAVELPRYAAAPMRRAAAALWGHIPEAELTHWEERFSLTERYGDDAYGALVRGQAGGRTTSPLLLTSQLMGLVASSVFEWPFVWVIRQPTFNELVSFWNYRSRAYADTTGAPVLGVLASMLRRPGVLGVLRDWARPYPAMQKTPDMYVACPEGLRGKLRDALAHVPIAERQSGEPRTRVTRIAEPRGPVAFAFARGQVFGQLVRGTSATSLAAFGDGRTSVTLPAPATFGLRDLSLTRLVIVNLPLALPLTASAARRMHPNGCASSDGLALVLHAEAEWHLDLALPAGAVALADWAADHGLRVTRSQDGRDAEALLGRLDTVSDLDIFADQERYRLLRALAPLSRVKLAQRIVGEAARAGARLDEEEMVQRLSDVGVFLEAQARTANELASALGIRQATVLKLLGPLVERGFVRRGYLVRCPECRFQEVLGLAEQRERVRCGACGAAFTLPVADESGAREPPRVYRLDGLMARAMDQDVLPMLLTLRKARPSAEPPWPYGWPGVEFHAGDGEEPVEVDLVTWGVVWEVKQSAAYFDESQLRRRLSLADAVEARVGIAAADGEFPQKVLDVVTAANGLVRGPDALFN